MFMDISQDFEPPHDGVVRWVASQSPNPALQALMKEAERDKKSRPSTPIHEPMSWTYPLTSTTSSASLSASVASSWHSGSHNSANASYLPLLSGSSSASSSSLAPRASDPSGSRRAKPLSATQRKPLASSTSSANQPLRDSARPRSSSHSTTLSDPPTLKEKYVPREEGPEAMAFIELLKDVSRQLDDNSKKKQRLVVRAKEKEREHSLGRSSIDNRVGLDAHHSGTRPLAKTSSASAICPVGPTARALERTSSTSMSHFRPDPRGRLIARTASLGPPSVDLVTGKSTSPSLPSSNLNCDLKLAPAPRLLTRPSDISNTNHLDTPEPTPDDGDSAMQDVIDLTETDTEWERPISRSMMRADTTTYMQVDDEDSDTGMDVSFFRAEPPPQPHVIPPKPKPHPPQPRPPVPTQRTRTAPPPPLGMRRAPQLQPSQYGASQVSKSLTVAPFKPPLLAHAGGKGGSETRLVTTTNSRPTPRGGAAKVPVAKAASRGSQDADSSFDVSFGVDAEALEEAMKAYD